MPSTTEGAPHVPEQATTAAETPAAGRGYRYAPPKPLVKLPPAFRTISNGYGACLVTLNAAGAVLTGIVAARLDMGWLYPIAFVLAGRQLYALYILQHDALHWLLFSSRSLNDAAGTLLSAMIGTRLSSSRAIHGRHHAIVGQADDPNAFFYGTADKAPPGPALGFLLGQACGLRILTFARMRLASVLSGGRAQPARAVPRVPTHAAGNLRQAVVEFAAVATVQGAILALYTVTVGPLMYVLLYGLPAVTVTAGFDAVRAFAEHLLPGEQPRNWAEENRNFYNASPALERFFLAPFGFHWHHVHHLYRTVPAYRLGALHHWLCEHDDAFGDRYAARGAYLSVVARYLMRRPVTP